MIQNQAAPQIMQDRTALPPRDDAHALAWLQGKGPRSIMEAEGQRHLGGELSR
jgi:hypothetical protein